MIMLMSYNFMYSNNNEHNFLFIRLGLMYLHSNKYDFLFIRLGFNFLQIFAIIYIFLV